jgi:hypothetical protein
MLAKTFISSYDFADMSKQRNFPSLKSMFFKLNISHASVDCTPVGSDVCISSLKFKTKIFHSLQNIQKVSRWQLKRFLCESTIQFFSILTLIKNFLFVLSFAKPFQCTSFLQPAGYGVKKASCIISSQACPSAAESLYLIGSLSRNCQLSLPN